MLSYSQTTLTELKDIAHSYLPTKESVNLNAGKQVEVDVYTIHLITQFNNLVKALEEIDGWVENRGHSDNDFKVVDGVYQVSASCCYVSKDEPRVFTVKLHLHEQLNYLPAKLVINICNPSLPAPPEPFEYDFGLEWLELCDAETNAKVISGLVAKMVNNLDKRITDDGGARFNIESTEKLDIADDYDFDLNFIKKRFLPFSVDELSDIKLVGFSLDNEVPIFYVSYSTKNGTGVHEIKLHDYLSARFAH